MSETLWFDWEPGDTGRTVEDVSDRLTPEGGGALLIHSGLPDWVRRPDTGARVRVRGGVLHEGPCPKCNAETDAKALVLEDGVVVRDCKSCNQFIWFQKRENS